MPGNGQGPRLQSLLKQYDEENDAKVKAGDESAFCTYFEEFWNDAYLAPKSSVVGLNYRCSLHAWAMHAS